MHTLVGSEHINAYITWKAAPCQHRQQWWITWSGTLYSSVSLYHLWYKDTGSKQEVVCMPQSICRYEWYPFRVMYNSPETIVCTNHHIEHRRFQRGFCNTHCGGVALIVIFNIRMQRSQAWPYTHLWKCCSSHTHRTPYYRQQLVDMPPTDELSLAWCQTWKWPENVANRAERGQEGKGGTWRREDVPLVQT